MAIVTQKISLNLTQSKLPPLIMHTDEQGRRIHFELVDENGDVITLTDDYSARYSQKKPDGNFVSELLSISENGKLLILNQVTQMTAVPGISYYDINVYNGSDIIYSGQGRVVVDDHILDNDTIISVSETDGLVFPDDFYSKNDPVAEIDDNVTSLTKAWSSSKIFGVIGDAISTAEGYTDAAIAALPSQLDVYSTTEQVVGTWIDGSTVYEQTIEITSYSGTTTSISIENLEKLVDVKGYGIYNNSQCMTLPYYYNSNDYVRMYTQPGYLKVEAGSVYRSDYTKTIVTIRYTKSS